ncbi:hypothetical protein [Rathayibacter sp. VKM Ac-2754]|uniref:hypothetical protein n=1 Tax=Rathayibacter sp. VKM Ac-2754 TaxID=2609251 RepID=UPI00135A46A1|nr:hypothetical protein [Rathayibacter sp. VKM Ac-2754]MWV57350.1 hypothetical protein [Rathayibacter sp. VKM Ac-2754]
MIRLLRTAVPIAVLAVALAACSSPAIDIPEGAQVTVAPATTAPAVETGAVEPTPEQAATTPTAPPLQALDCAAILPVETIEEALGLPSGFVTASGETDGCSWAMAGNPSALALQAATGATEDTVDEQEATGATESSELGDRAFFRAGDPAGDAASTLVVLVGDQLVTVRSFVGDQEAIETLATDALGVLGLDPS